MFSKITTSLLYNSISVFIILLQIFFLFNFLSVFCNSIPVKVLMISCFQTLVLSFITNNVKGIQSYKKRLKLIQYFKEKIGSTGVLFLQETHSSSKVEQKWKEDFKGHVFFSHGKTNSCGVLTAYFRKETFNVKKKELIRKVAF